MPVNVGVVSFVAGATRSQRRELTDRNVVTLAGLAALGAVVRKRRTRAAVR